MKTYGLKTIITISAFLVASVLAYVLIPGVKNEGTALGFPCAIALAQLLYAPIIKLNNERLRIATLAPFYKNIDVQLADVRKITIDVNYTMRVVLHMKDGTIKSTIMSRYAYDMKPLYYQLNETGVEFESQGIGTIDWGK